MAPDCTICCREHRVSTHFKRPCRVCLSVSLFLSELVPCVGGLQCQGHETALATQVRRGSSQQRRLVGKKSCTTFIDSGFVMRSCCSEHVSCICRTTILAAVAFLDAFQKVADMATNSRGKLVFCTDVSVLEMSSYSMMELHQHLLKDECSPFFHQHTFFSLLDLFCTTARRFLSLLGSWIREVSHESTSAG